MKLCTQHYSHLLHAVRKHTPNIRPPSTTPNFVSEYPIWLPCERQPNTSTFKISISTNNNRSTDTIATFYDVAHLQILKEKNVFFLREIFKTALNFGRQFNFAMQLVPTNMNLVKYHSSQMHFSHTNKQTNNNRTHFP